MHTILEKENKWNKTNQWENELEQLHAIIRKTPLVETTVRLQTKLDFC